MEWLFRRNIADTAIHPHHVPLLPWNLVPIEPTSREPANYGWLRILAFS